MLYTMQSKAFCCHLYHTYLTLCKIILYDELEGGGVLPQGWSKKAKNFFLNFSLLCYFLLICRSEFMVCYSVKMS